MSTFSGVVSEFPSIRIDNFTSVAGAAPPLAYFVSHIHSDHIVGLAAYKSPTFIYCSATTKDLLLKLETFSNRQNFDNGITETKNKHLSHLESYLRPLPLNTPTNIQLTPREAIRVTLFDVCPNSSGAEFIH
jgi:DNA cross-link repair 1C protein